MSLASVPAAKVPMATPAASLPFASVGAPVFAQSFEADATVTKKDEVIIIAETIASMISNTIGLPTATLGLFTRDPSTQRRVFRSTTAALEHSQHIYQRIDEAPHYWHIWLIFSMQPMKKERWGAFASLFGSGERATKVSVRMCIALEDASTFTLSPPIDVVDNNNNNINAQSTLTLSAASTRIRTDNENDRTLSAVTSSTSTFSSTTSTFPRLSDGESPLLQPSGGVVTGTRVGRVGLDTPNAERVSYVDCISHGQLLYVLNASMRAVEVYRPISSTAGITCTRERTIVVPFGSGMALTPDGRHIYLSNWLDQCVYIVSIDGGHRRSFACDGSPRGIAIANDEVYVVRSVTNHVSVFSLDGTFKRSFGHPIAVGSASRHTSVTDAELSTPERIAVDAATGEVWLCDAGAPSEGIRPCIHIWSEGGAEYRGCIDRILSATGCSAVTLSAEYAYVATNNGTITAISRQTWKPLESWQASSLPLVVDPKAEPVAPSPLVALTIAPSGALVACFARGFELYC